MVFLSIEENLAQLPERRLFLLENASAHTYGVLKLTWRLRFLVHKKEEVKRGKGREERERRGLHVHTVSVQERTRIWRMKRFHCQANGRLWSKNQTR